MTVPNENGQAPPPPPPPNQPKGPAKVLPKLGGGSMNVDLLMDEIRGGVALKPTKTKDRSSPAFARQPKGNNDSGNGTSPMSPTTPNGLGDQGEDIKDALQAELRNTLKRKVKREDVESGDITKQNEIEKSMEQNRTEIQLKVNSPVNKSPSDKTIAGRDVVDKAPVKSPALEHKLQAKSPVVSNGLSSSTKSPVVARSGVTVSSDKADLQHKSSTVTDKPIASPKMEGKLKKVPPVGELKINVDLPENGDHMKNAILSPEVKSGTASIRPSQIKTLTQSGGYVSHTDIVETPKPIQKSSISLVESPKPAYSPPTPKTPVKTHTNNGYNTLPRMPKTPAPITSAPSSPRTLILDTKFGFTPKSPISTDPNNAPKKLLISHPKASFTLPRSKRTNGSTTPLPENKPVFRILTDLEAAERQQETTQTNGAQVRTDQKLPPVGPPKADTPGVEPILTSYVSFSKEMANATNNYPDTVRTTTTVGVKKEDLFLGGTNLRDVKFDIVENGQLRIVNK